MYLCTCQVYRSYNHWIISNWQCCTSHRNFRYTSKELIVKVIKWRKKCHSWFLEACFFDTANNDPDRTITTLSRCGGCFCDRREAKKPDATIAERVRYLQQKPYNRHQSHSIVAIKYFGFQVYRTAILSCKSRRRGIQSVTLYVETARYRREILRLTWRGLSMEHR